jgi:hypothetical protein
MESEKVKEFAYRIAVSAACFEACVAFCCFCKSASRAACYQIKNEEDRERERERGRGSTFESALSLAA